MPSRPERSCWAHPCRAAAAGSSGSGCHSPPANACGHSRHWGRRRQTPSCNGGGVGGLEVDLCRQRSTFCPAKHRGWPRQSSQFFGAGAAFLRFWAPGAPVCPNPGRHSLVALAAAPHPPEDGLQEVHAAPLLQALLAVAVVPAPAEGRHRRPSHPPASHAAQEEGRALRGAGPRGRRTWLPSPPPPPTPPCSAARTRGPSTTAGLRGLSRSGSCCRCCSRRRRCCAAGRCGCRRCAQGKGGGGGAGAS